MLPRLRVVFLAAVFGLTGVGTALLGATLPAILQRWHLTDNDGGVLLLAAWSGSTSGAFFVRGRSGLSIAAGLVLSSAGLLALSVIGHPGALIALYALYGVGLGITMTSISVLRAREVYPARVDLELNRLNLFWAVGALCSPVLALHSLQLLSATSLFRVLGVVLGTAAVLAFVFAMTPGISIRQQHTDHLTSHPAPLPWAPLRLGLFAACSVGMESAVGSWLTTYASRVATNLSTATSANAAFWLGLLLSRAAHSLLAAERFHGRAVRAGHVVLASVSTVLLILAPTPLVLPVAGFLCGVGLGPLYPFVLSVALPRFRSTWIFVLAGVGASLTPWLTGAFSSVTGSLRLGIVVPALTAALLCAVTLRMRSELDGTP